MANITGFNPTRANQGAAPALLDGDVTVTGTAANNRLVLSGLLAEDRITIRTGSGVTLSNTGTANGQPTGTISVGGIVVGTYSGGTGATFTVQFNASATAANIETVVENLLYQDVSQTPTASRNLTLTLTAPDTFAAENAGGNPFAGIDGGTYSAPAIANVTGDARPDLVVSAFDGSGKTVLLTFEQQTDGSFAARTGAANPFNNLNNRSQGFGYSALPAFVDLNGDGVAELVVGQTDAGQNRSLEVYQRSGGQYVAATSNPFAAINASNAGVGGAGGNVGTYAAPTFVDWDGDGDQDLLTGDDRGEIRLYLNTGSRTAPTFTTANTLLLDVTTGAGRATTVAATDLDGDGDLDLVVTNTGQDGDAATLNDVFVYTNNGGTFTRAATDPFVTGQSQPIIALGDIDNNGTADIVYGGNDGTVSVQRRTAGATSSQTAELTVNARPTGTVAISDTSLIAGETATVTITFSEAVLDFSASDLTVENGTLGALSTLDNGITYTATFTPTANITDPTNVITLNQAGVTDVEGLAGQGTATSPNYAIDTQRPTATITSSAGANGGATRTSPLPFTVTFSESVTGFVAGDVTVTNGTLSGLSGSGSTYTFNVTPAGQGQVSVQLAANMVQDAAGNGNTASPTFTLTSDTVAPTATIVVSDNNLTPGETSLVTITFSERVTGFDNSDLVVQNGTLSPVSTSDGGLTYTATLTPAANTTANGNTIQLTNAGVVDQVGNPGSGTTFSNPYTVATAANAAPAITNLQGDVLTYAEGAGELRIDQGGTVGNAVVADADSANFDGGALNVRITAGRAGTEERFVAIDGFSVTADNGQFLVVSGGVLVGTVTGWSEGRFAAAGADLLFLFNANATPALVQRIVRGLGYQNLGGDTPTGGARTVSWTLNDGDGNANGGNPETTVTSTIQVNPVNDAPTVAITPLPTVLENGQVSLKGQIAVADADAGTGELTVTIAITPSSGALEFGIGNSGVAFVTFETNPTGINSLTVRGTTAQIGAFLGTTQSTSFLNFVAANDAPPASTTLTVTVNDNGNTGGAAQTGTGTTTIAITAVNDAPVIGALDGDSVAYTQNAAPVRIDLDANATVTDADSVNFDGGSFTFAITNRRSGDQASVLSDQGVIFDGSTFAVNGTVISSGISQTSNSVTITFNDQATPARVQALIRSFGFQSNSAEAGDRTFTWTLNDGDGDQNGGNPIATATSTVAYTVANLAPSVDLNGSDGANGFAATYTEGGAGVAIANNPTLTDPDAGDRVESVTVRLAGAATDDQIVLAAGAPAAVTVVSTRQGSDIVVTLSGGSVEDLQTALGLVRYSNTGDDPTLKGTNTTRTITVTANDGTADSTPQTATITVVGVNDAPVIGALGGDRATFTEGQGAGVVYLDAGRDALVTDADNTSFAGGSLRVAVTGGNAAEDRIFFTFNNNGLTVNAATSELSYNNVVIGTYSPSSADRSFTFNANATLEAVQVLIRALNYANTNLENPVTGDHTITYTLTDGSGGSVERTSIVNVVPVNDAPSLSAPTANAVTFTEDAGPAVLFEGAVLIDVDRPASLQGGSITLSGGGEGGFVLSGASLFNAVNNGSNVIQLVLRADPTVVLGTITGYGTTNLQVTDLTAAATVARIRDLVNGDFVYTNASDTPVTGDRTVTLTVNDGGNVGGGALNSNTITQTLTVVSNNDAPVNSLPASLTVAEDGVIIFDGVGTPAIGVSDVDAGPGGQLTTTLTATNGLLEGRNGVPAASVAVSGTAGEISSQLNGLRFRPNADFNGTASIQVVTSDNGNSGQGGAKTDTDTIQITVTPVNDAPVLDLDTAADGTGSAVTYTENAPFALLAPLASVIDVDANLGGGRLVVDTRQLILTEDNLVTVPNDRLTLVQMGTTVTYSYDGTEFARVDLAGVLGGSLTFTLLPAASVAAVQALGRAFAFTNASDNPTAGARDFPVTLFDADGAASATATARVTVVAVNDAPVLDLDGASDSVAVTLNYTENDPATAIAPTAIVTDPDSANFDGGSLTVAFTSGAEAADVLSVISSGNIRAIDGEVQVLVDGIPFTIGTVSGGSNGQSLVVALNANATPARVQSLVAAIGYANTSDNPSGDARLLQFVLTDGDTGTTVTNAQINVAPVDDAPVARPDAAGTLETAVTSGTVLANDSDVDGPALSVSAVNGSAANVGRQITLASGALLTLNADGSYSYNPNGAFERLADPASGAPADQTQATDSFTYTLVGASEPTTVTVTVTGVDNRDVVVINDSTPGSVRTVSTGGADDQVTGTGTARYVIDGGSGNDTIRTDAGNDRVIGGTGNDTIETGAGNDDVEAGEGDDTIVGGAGEGDDYYNGGGGNDTLTYTSQGPGANLVINLIEADRSQGAGAVFPAGAPADTAARLAAILARQTPSLPANTPVGYAYGGAIGVDALRGIENVVSGAGDDVIVGSAGANRIDAGAGNDLVSGGGGNDVLIGGEGNDTLFYGDLTNSVQVNLAEGQVNAGLQGGVDLVSGFENAVLGSGNDQFIGDANDNIVEGGAGNDQIDGGAGTDTALYRGVQAADGTAIQLGNELSFAPGGGLGTDRLTGIERVTFVNGADVFTVTVQDGNALVASRNDANAVTATSTTTPGSTPASVSATAATGVLANDVNLDQGLLDQKVVAAVSAGTTATPATANVGQAIVGTYGTLTLNADGSYTYVADQAATVALTAGTAAQDVFTYRADDGDVGDSTPATLTFTVTGTNETATITGTATGAVTEDASSPLLQSSGQLTATDADTGEAGFRPQSNVVGSNGYGRFGISDTGLWQYFADNNQAAVQQLGAGDTLTDSFTVFSTDGTASQVVTVTITGTNDAVVLTGGQITAIADTSGTDSFGVVTGRIDNDPDVLGASGIGQLTDTDRGDVYTYALVGTPDTTYGTLALGSDGSYTFTPNDAAINALAGGTAVVTYQVQVSDNAGSTSTADFTVTVTGANDNATIGGQLTGSVTEDVGITDGSLIATGTVTVTDVDTAQATIQPQQGTFGDFGAFSIDGLGNWTYEVDNAAVQFLGAGESLTESFEVRSQDGTGTATVVVTVNGTNDTPVVTGELLATYDDTSATDDFGVLSGQISNQNSNGLFVIDAEELGDQPVGSLFDADINDRAFTFARAGSAEENAVNDAYGTLVVNGDGSYTFTPNDAAINALTGPLTLTYTISATDDSETGNATGTGTFTIQLNGVEDAPVTGGNTTASVTEDAVAPGTTNLVATGTLTVADADTNQSSYRPQTATGTYGTFVLAADGSYTYTADNTQRSIQEIGQGSSRTDSFTAVTADGTQVPVTVTINGVNDAPVVVETVLADVTAANGSFAAATSLDGLFVLAPNANVGNATTVPHVSIQGTTSAGVIDYYSFTVGAGGGTVTLDVDNADFDTGIAIYDAAGNRLGANDDSSVELGADENTVNSFLTLNLAAGTYTVAIDRYPGVGSGNGPNLAQPGSTYQLQVSLTNPATPAVSYPVAGGPYTQVAAETNAAIALTGQLVVLDDVGDTQTYANLGNSVSAEGRVLTDAQRAAIAGAFTIDAATGAYSFNLPSPDYLDPGQSITATFTVRVSDQFGATDTQNVTFVVTGTIEQGPVGTEDDDVLTGTQIGETITGLGGDDIIRGLAGNDQIDAGDGDDQVDGGSGDDTIFGGAGDDILVGGSGNDTIDGGDDNDTISGGAGDDVLSGGRGTNTVDGGAGNDTGVLELTSDQYLITRTGPTTVVFATNDGSERTTFTNVEGYRFVDGTTLVVGADGGLTLTGDGEDNRLASGAGNDTLSGGAGNDTLAPGAGTNTVDGGAGNDTGVLGGNYADYTITQGDGAVTFVRNGGGETSRFANVENYRFADGVGLSIQANGTRFFTLPGDFNTTLATGAGNDLIFAGARRGRVALTGADRIDGGAGNDQLGLEGNYVGPDRLVLEAGTLSNIELLALIGGNYDIVWNDAGVGAGQVFTVFATNNGGDVTFDGSAETDGSFLMYGGLGTDRFIGGAGNDSFFFGPDRFGEDDVVVGGAGANDQMALDGSYSVTVDARFGVEVLALLGGTETERNVFDVTLADEWIGAGETKTMFALFVTTDLLVDASAETDGNVRIIAGSGNDTLIGGAGNDFLFGGVGADRLAGGAGNDLFVFNAASDSASTGFDTILDFDRTADTIQVNGQTYADFTDRTGGTLSQGSFDADLANAVGTGLAGSSGVVFTATEGDYAGQTFLVVNTDGVDGYQAGSDLVIRLGEPDPVIQPLSVAAVDPAANDLHNQHAIIG